VTYYLLHAGQPSAQRLLKRVKRLKTYVSNNLINQQDVVIRWGESRESDPLQAQMLNSLEAINRTKSRNNMGRLLKRFGVRFLYSEKSGLPEGSRIVRQYRIPVFDLHPLACFQLDSGPAWINKRIARVQESFREVPMDVDRAATRACRLAIRGLHALGLQHGLVSIGMGTKGVQYIIDLTAQPVLRGRLLDLFGKAVEDFMERDEQARQVGQNQVVIGTDIEIMLRNASGKMVLASKYLPRKGRVGCDDRSVNFDGKRLPLVELRPEPESSPLFLLNNLRDTMSEASASINRSHVQWRAGSMPFRPYSTGGHIHFSNVAFSSHLVRVLDSYVGLPLMLVEDQRTARLRRPKYGFLGDVRQKDYGGFEYRTPASFVINPEITAAALCLAYTAVVHHKELPAFDLYEPNLQQAFYSGSTEILRPIAERSLTALRHTGTYERYREYIEPLFNMIRERRTWDEATDIRVTWGVPLQSKRSVRKSPRRAMARAQ
jgi:hypothetical protein